MEYDVLQCGYKLLPNFHFITAGGILAFTSHHIDTEWRDRCRPPERYVTTAVVPGNLLNEGTIIVSAGMESVEPSILQFYEPDVFAFQVVDEMELEGSARGHHGGNIETAVRLLLRWLNQLLYAAAEYSSGEESEVSEWSLNGMPPRIGR